MEPIQLGEESDLFLSVRRNGSRILVEIRRYRIGGNTCTGSRVALTRRMWSRFMRYEKSLEDALGDTGINLGREVYLGKRKNIIFLKRRSTLLVLPPASWEAISCVQWKVNSEIGRLLTELEALKPRDITEPTTMPPPTNLTW